VSKNWEEINKKKSVIMDKYPLLYADRNKPMQQTCMCWGLEVGEGWLPMIDELSAKLEEEIKQYIKENPGLDYYPRASQVKEKFGGLRFYMMTSTDKMEEIISEYEAKSETICESCGKPGDIKGGGWLVCNCDECYNERNSK
jgi:hypothetical protein